MDDTAEIVEVPVRKFEVNLTLDDLLTRLSERANALAASGTQDAPDPELAQHLRDLGELAGQLREKLGIVNQINPSMLSRPSQDAAAPGDDVSPS